MRNKYSWFASVTLLLNLLACKPATTYQITGNISNAKGNGLAILQDLITYEEDTVPFVDGQFTFTGKQEIAKLYRLYFITPTDTMISQMRSDLLYVQNGKIEISGSYDNMMPLVGNIAKDQQRLSIESDGKEGQLYEAYLTEVRPLVLEASAISQSLEYPEVPAEDMNEQQYAKALSNQRHMMDLLSQRNAIKDRFINEVPQSQLAYDFVFASVAMDYHCEAWFDEYVAHGNQYPEYLDLPDTAKMDEWYSLLAKQNTFTQSQMDTLEVLINKCKKLTPGAPFIDAQLTTTEGEKVALSSQLQDGKYTVIDCWASWCHPCRASIPHLKQLYEKYQPKGLNIIGISFDDYQYMKDQWLKAIQVEQMPWPQFQAEFDSELGKGYHITAIPNILIITPDKKILKTGVRGFDLDVILQNIYGF